MDKPLNTKEIGLQRSMHCPDWDLHKSHLQKQFSFANFKEAVDFVNLIAPIAEAQRHHPDIQINYNKVHLSLTTKDSNGITQKDFALAMEIDTLLKK